MGRQNATQQISPRHWKKGKSPGHLIDSGRTTNEKTAAPVEALREKAPWVHDAPVPSDRRNFECGPLFYLLTLDGDRSS